MKRSLAVASVQMEASTAPTAERLERARALIEQASIAGAELVVLPELFNTGYTYDATNWARAEPMDGPTPRFLEDVARTRRVYVAGSFMLSEGGDVYNTLMLVAPDGGRHRYDKIYPWGFERAAFRGSRGGTSVAETPLGRIGMLVCWDTSHPALWGAYAGKVDFMLVASCPPDVSKPTYHLGDGTTITANDIPLLRRLTGSAQTLFGDMFDEQARWLGVPAVNTVGCGRVTTPLPRALPMALGFALFAPKLGRHLRRLDRVDMTCDLTPGCKVLDAEGRRVVERSQEQGEGFVVGEVVLGGAPQAPRGPQPPSRLPRAAYWLSDVLLPRLMEPVYREGVRATLITRSTLSCGSP